MADGVVNNSTKLRPHKESYKEHCLHLLVVCTQGTFNHFGLSLKNLINLCIPFSVV